LAALNRGRHLYSAERPSRWALAHVLVLSSSYGRPAWEMRTLYFLPCGFFLSFYAYNLSHRPQIGCLPYFDTWCAPSANLECIGLKCAARGSLEMQDPKFAKSRHLGTIAQLCPAISSQRRHVSTIGKILVKRQYLLHMSPQYGELRPIAAEIGSGIWDNPANFNGFRILAALLHCILVVGIR